MPPFFQSKTKISEESIEKLVTDSIKYFKNQHSTINLISRKKWAFQRQLSLCDNIFEKEAILRCYALFAKTLINCVRVPQDMPILVRNYYYSSDYCHIGGDETYYSYTLFDDVNTMLLKASFTAFVFSFIALPFSVPLSLIVLGTSLSILLPTAFYALVETVPHQAIVKQEEDELFKQVHLSLSSEKPIASIEVIAQTTPQVCG
ncbi:lpg1689 family Dot/Icm T4SS effector [Legionella hackeliae]|uniref:Uncharacterized protein n=1 Tax=Legionella hackeliae TaxID=449 RepID=A0A0A8USL8_LEGHA|nr:hypothetical protein [Legionella hackeliae]KTD13805.1 23, 7 kDa protein [Legionella hackeliae]CEK10506.1 protein of unknown function [Legionella hackeliae]STX47243.1 Integral membrane protein (PIN domain superfamily) [Legionella hackeliae]